MNWIDSLIFNPICFMFKPSTMFRMEKNVHRQVVNLRRYTRFCVPATVVTPFPIFVTSKPQHFPFSSASCALAARLALARPASGPSFLFWPYDHIIIINRMHNDNVTTPLAC